MTETRFTDMTIARPESAWVPDRCYGAIPEKPAGGWRVLDYTCDAFSGKMLTTTQRDAAVLTIPLKLGGWHALWLGIGAEMHHEGALDVRLSGDAHWRTVRKIKSSREEPWIMADLTGRDLEIRPPRDARFDENRGEVCNLMSIRAVPMPDEDVRLIAADESRKLVQINDGNVIFRPNTPGPQTVENALAPFVESPWRICCFSGGTCDSGMHYPSGVGTVQGAGWDHTARETLDAMRQPIIDGWDPLRQAIQQAHEQGREIWIYNRTAGWGAPWPMDHRWRSPSYAGHLYCRCIEADGNPLPQLSIAYPEVRRQLNAVASEAIERGADGFCIALNRGYPLVRWEEPVRTRFRQVHGADARDRSADDRDLRAIWCEFVETWIRELRQQLDEAGASEATGGRRKLTIITGPDLDWNLRFGVDVARLAAEGLLDAVVTYPYVWREKKMHLVPESTSEYARALDGTRVPFYPSLGSWADHDIGLGEYRRRAHAFYAAGADGLSRWDTDAHLARVRLDSPARVRLWVEKYHPQERSLNILEIGGIPYKMAGAAY